MREDQKSEFGRMWTDCWAMYGKSVSPGVLDLAFQALRRYELSDISRALSRHLNDPDAGQFAPKPADVVRNLDGSKETRAMLAWSKVEKAIRRVGSYQSVVFDDPIIHAVIQDMGGWCDLNKITEDETPFKAREFEKRYQGYALRPPSEYPRTLSGIFEATNRLNGHKTQPPVLLGNKDRAVLVYQNGSDETGIKMHRLDVDIQKTVAAITDARQEKSA